MTPHKLTKTYRRKLARYINRQTAGYLWTLTPAGEAYFAESDVNARWARIGYATKLVELSNELLELEQRLSQ